METLTQNIRWQILRTALLLFFSLVTAFAQDNVKRPLTGGHAEYDVKAAFLLNFARFVEWPQAAERGGAPFAICIVGDDPFGESLNRIVTGESISGRPFVVRHPQKWPAPCDLLFVPASHPSQAAVLAQAGPDVLTVGEAPEFLRDGGMIQFVIDDRRIRFDISRQAADRSALKMSSRLLGVARTVLK